VNEIAALFRQLTLGVYVVGVAHGDRRNAFTAAWLTQASFGPPLLVLGINPQNASYPLLRAAGCFAVSVLKQGQIELARHFGTPARPGADKLEGIAWRPSRSGAPVLEAALAHFDCELTTVVPAGDHELVVGRAVGGGILDRDGIPMTYAETGDMDGSSALYPARW
jgi:flavin reductase (DIM6/NTAB) family NADH-FMN oxidoreductase RutF